MKTFAYSMRMAWTVVSDLYIPPGGSPREGCGYAECPRWSRWLRLLIGAPALGFHQWYFGYVVDWERRRWLAVRTAPGHFAYWLQLRLDDYLGRHDRWYRWNQPMGDFAITGDGSFAPTEIGFWSLSDGSHQRSPMRVLVWS